jgi:uncharacterized protein DUF6316
MENNKNKRHRDKNNSPFRSSRFYSIATEWYFSVRETVDQGPYSSKLIAENSLKTYLLDLEHFNTREVNKIKLF